VSTSNAVARPPTSSSRAPQHPRFIGSSPGARGGRQTTIMAMMEYGVRSLADAMVEARRWRNAAAELRDYHVKKLNVLQQALGGSGDPHEADDAGRMAGLSSLLDVTVTLLAGSLSPFDGFLETPDGVVAMFRRHGSAIRNAANGLEGALMALLTELIVEMYSIPPLTS
jgi:hypothetical protein